MKKKAVKSKRVLYFRSHVELMLAIDQQVFKGVLSGSGQIDQGGIQVLIHDLLTQSLVINTALTGTSNRKL